VARRASAARPYKLRLGAKNGVNFLSECVKPFPALMEDDPRRHFGMESR
jgi:hypothetical protein